ncbi:hypothetical protein C2G38_2149892 [Gigaspora rosea]|uniref:Uncharacterized protein n=1 Tax=Gigaspora rosea TaxID=44941 RepID=A0A397U0W2_9GLOM|nr:hypothetical protein C2G38_2149892 [Gigaspora rosea]
MSRKINDIFILVILICIVIQSLMKIDEIRAKDEILFMKNEINRYEDKIRVKDEMLLFMENEKHRCDEKLDASITKETMYDKELRQNKLEIENCEYKCNIKDNIIEKFVNDINKIIDRKDKYNIKDIINVIKNFFNWA